MNFLWKYVEKLEKENFGGGNTKFKCSYCNLTYNGSYFRVRSHLLKISGNRIRCCPKVTSSHLAEMQKIDAEVEKTKALKTKKVHFLPQRLIRLLVPPLRHILPLK
ncbi:hypothetical protein AXF42_Ash018962 [Apostasia shenzhenica]|uniref:BED-type domain-containing protein n=1 Tax=Apostasia shenzhenica TaxID=1088818 RepID=A0A2I0B4N7_9ASPA|nr:hypothetical protein AXF42_Ash018962 [Apostasia shenzhenica]